MHPIRLTLDLQSIAPDRRIRFLSALARVYGISLDEALAVAREGRPGDRVGVIDVAIIVRISRIANAEPEPLRPSHPPCQFELPRGVVLVEGPLEAIMRRVNAPRIADEAVAKL